MKYDGVLYFNNSPFNGIYWNYLLKEVAYKTKVRLMTVVIKQSDLIINFDKFVKEFDTKNLLK